MSRALEVLLARSGAVFSDSFLDFLWIIVYLEEKGG